MTSFSVTDLAQRTHLLWPPHRALSSRHKLSLNYPQGEQNMTMLHCEVELLLAALEGKNWYRYALTLITLVMS